MNRSPCASTARPKGLCSWADVAGPPSPPKPAVELGPHVCPATGDDPRGGVDAPDGQAAVLVVVDVAGGIGGHGLGKGQRGVGRTLAVTRAASRHGGDLRGTDSLVGAGRCPDADDRRRPRRRLRRP